MSDTPLTHDKLELSQHQTKLWAVLGIVAFLLVIVNGAFTFFITSSATEMRETNRNLVEVMATMRVVQVQADFQQKQIQELQASQKEAGTAHQGLETRLNAIEQSLALHNQWIQDHNK